MPTSLRQRRANAGKTPVFCTAKVTNVVDWMRAGDGGIEEGEIRSCDVTFLVDIECLAAEIPRTIFERLGLHENFRAVRIEYLDRDATVEVDVSDHESPARLGRVPLDLMDLVVNPKEHRLEGNPAHGGEYVLDMI